MKKSVLLITFCALFAAIICVSCFIKIPLGPIPIVIQNAMCVLVGAILGSWIGGIPTLIFLLAGLIGLPVYSGGTSGIAVWIGPTGGFLPGYFLGALICGLICGKPKIEEKKITFKSFIRITLGIVAGMVILYIPGVFYFAHWATNAGKVPVDKSVFAYTMAACVIPYIPGDLLKIVVAVPVALKIRPVAAQYLYQK